MAATGFTYYAPIEITTTDAAQSGYTVRYSVNHAALVSASKSAADGSDYRIFYDSSASFSGSETEIDRVLWELDGTESTWNNASTTIAFKLQTGIDGSGGDTTHYRAYYGKESPGTPPTDKNNVYVKFDGFDTDTSGNYTATSCTPSISAGVMSFAVASEPGGVIYTTALTAGNDFEVQFKIKSTNANSGNNYQYAGWYLRDTGIDFNDISLRFNYINDYFQLRGPAGNNLCANAPYSHSAHTSLSLNDAFHTFRLTKSGNACVAYCDGTAHYGQNETITPQYFGFGMNHAGETCYFDDFRVRFFTTNEPSLALGDEVGGNQNPTKPTNSTPLDAAVNFPYLGGTLTASAFSDPDGTADTHGSSIWQVATDTGFATVSWTSNWSTAQLEAATINSTNGTFTSGTQLDYLGTYYWHVSYADDKGGSSTYSDYTSFVTLGSPSQVVAWHSEPVKNLAKAPVDVARKSQVSSVGTAPYFDGFDGMLTVNTLLSDLHFYSGTAWYQTMKQGGTVNITTGTAGTIQAGVGTIDDLTVSTINATVGTVETLVGTTLTGSTIDYGVGTIDDLVASTANLALGTFGTVIGTVGTIPTLTNTTFQGALGTFGTVIGTVGTIPTLTNTTFQGGLGTFGTVIGTTGTITTLTNTTFQGGLGTFGTVVGTVGTIPTLVSTTATATTVNAGSVVASGMVRLGSTWHAYGGFQDQLATITVATASTWYHITNAGSNLWTGLEADGLTLSGDVMTFTNAGDYVGAVSITLSALQGKDYEIRLYNNTQGTIMGYKQGVTTTGAGNYMNVTLPLYIEAAASDQMQLEIQNITDTTDPVLKQAVFYLTYLHD